MGSNIIRVCIYEIDYLASDWQCWSAPSRPPRSAPLPGPTLVMKNVISLPALACGDCTVAQLISVNKPAATNNVHCVTLCIRPSGQIDLRWGQENQTPLFSLEPTVAPDR